MKSTYISFSGTLAQEQFDEALKMMQSRSDQRTLGLRFPDGTYRVVANIVKLEDCPQEVFNEAIEILAKL